LGLSTSCITLPPTVHLSSHNILKKKEFEKIIKIDEKKKEEKVALIKTDYEEWRLQPTQAGHPKLATPLFPSPYDILNIRILKIHRN
jgi:hypothetical protein